MSGSPVMVARGIPSRTSRHKHYVPRSTKRTAWMPKAGEPDHPLEEPVRQICAELEHYKRRALRAEGALKPLLVEATHMVDQLADRGLPGMAGDSVDQALAAARAVMADAETSHLRRLLLTEAA